VTYTTLIKIHFIEDIITKDGLEKLILGQRFLSGETQVIICYNVPYDKNLCFKALYLKTPLWLLISKLNDISGGEVKKLEIISLFGLVYRIELEISINKYKLIPEYYFHVGSLSLLTMSKQQI
jgi:hypothetical protein